MVGKRASVSPRPFFDVAASLRTLDRNAAKARRCQGISADIALLDPEQRLANADLATGISYAIRTGD